MFVKKNIGIAKGLLCVFLIAVGWWAVFSPLNDFADRHAPADWQDDNTFKKNLCHLPDACAKYSATRLECAVAGNFENCIDVKMGHDGWLVDHCTTDGKPIYDDPRTPNVLECYLRKSDFLAKIIAINSTH
jgi:hypothetical protein